MAKNFETGDRVRAFDSWSNKSQGTGTVATVGESGAGVVLDRDDSGKPAHFYNSELTKVSERR